MHQPFDMSPGELPGAFFTDTGQWGDEGECPIWGDFDCPFDNDHDDYAFAFNDPPPKPRTWFADLENLQGTLLCRHEFPEPVNVKNGDILHVTYTLGLDGVEMKMTDVQTRVYPDPDYLIGAP